MRNIKKILKILIAIAIPVALVCLILFLVKVAGVDSVRSKETEHAYHVVPGEEIEYGKKDVLVAESETKRLYINPADLNVLIEDKTTGTVWTAVQPDSSKEEEKALVQMTYVGEDNQFETWDSFTYCLDNYVEGAETPAFHLYQLENGVRVQLHISEGASTRFYEYMPEKMSISNYNDVFLAGIDRLEEEGTITSAEAGKYRRAMALVYKKSMETESYNVNYVGSPPKSASNQLIKLTQLVGYTTEMLLQDAEDFNFTVEFTEPAIFDIAIDFMLEEDELVVNIPAEEIVNGNDYFTLTDVEVLPNFGMVSRKEVEEGYMLIPDGAGALARLNSYDAKVADYSRGFYNNDYYTDYYYRPEFSQELMMPVYGMYVLSVVASEEGTETEFVPYGFMAVIENGADAAVLETKLSPDPLTNSDRNYNKIYTKYNVSQYEYVPIFGEYATNKATYLKISPFTEEDYTLRFFFFTGDDTTYYTMAKTYQNYLCNGEIPEVYQDKAAIFLETIGTLSLEERILGIPYATEYSMTTYAELVQILEDLNGRNANIAYKGAFDGGMYHKLMNQGKLVSGNGTKAELDDLIAKVEGTDNSIYLETDFMKVYEGGNGYVKQLHSLQDYSNAAVTIYGYRVETGIFKQRSNSYNLLSPKYLVDAVADFKKNTDTSYNYYVNDLTEQYYADYGNSYISPFEAQRLVEEALQVLGEGSELALDNPRMDKIQNGAIAVDVSRESSELTMFYTSIPFRQLVLNGVTEYTTTSANNNSDRTGYYVMQALETGAQPKFTISYKNVDVLKDSKYSYYFSIQYDLLKEEIKSVYDEVETGMQLIGTAEIVNHKMLAKDVFETEYANGTRVVTNYTFETYSYEGHDIAANDYLILKGGN